MGVPIETSKQLDSKMKFMGLAVVFLVLNVLSPAASAPAPIIFFLPAAAPAILPTGALLLPAGTGALLATKVLLAGKTVAVKGAVLAKGGIAALATAAAVTAYQQQQQEQQQQQLR